MRRIMATVMVTVLAVTKAVGTPACERQQDAAALKTAALQQEMMVAAFACKAAGAYNNFVLTHRAALQASDRTLLAFFITANPRGGFDDYNLFKTELANNASLRSMRDALFCARVAAKFEAAEGHPLEQVLTLVPNPAGTGAIACPEPTSSAKITATATPR